MTTRRRPVHILIAAAVVGLAACGGDGGSSSDDPCAADEDGNAWPGDVADAIACDFDVNVRQVFVSHYQLPDDNPIPIVDTEGMDDREARIAQSDAMEKWTAANAAGTVDWKPGDERCEAIGGHVVRVESEMLGRPYVTYTCVVEDAEIPALNALAADES